MLINSLDPGRYGSNFKFLIVISNFKKYMYDFQTYHSE